VHDPADAFIVVSAVCDVRNAGESAHWRLEVSRVAPRSRVVRTMTVPPVVVNE
jgi:hypothetical protein